MKIKYNLGLLKNIDVGFIEYDTNRKIHGIIKNIKRTNNKYQFIYEKYIIEIDFDKINFFRLKKENNIIWFIFNKTPKISSLFVFTMYDTYGFPMEITKEILSEKEIEIDEEGFYILKELQKEKSKNTFKNKNAFN